MTPAPRGNGSTSPSPWASGLVVAALAAAVEVVVASWLYRDLPFVDRFRFFLFHGALTVAVTGLWGGTIAALARKLRPASSGAGAVGLGVAWAVLLAVRGYVVLASFHSFTRGEVRFIAIVAAGVVAGALAVTVLAHLLNRTGLASFRFAPLVLLACAIAAAGSFAVRSAAPRIRPSHPPATAPADARTLGGSEVNLLLIVIDTLRADHTSPYGYHWDTSPRLADLAARGVLFERCLTTRTNTTPAMASMLTGLYPTTLGVLDAGDVLDDRFVTLAEMLGEEGYSTGAFCANAMAGPLLNLDQGIDDFTLLEPGEMLESRKVNEAIFPWLARRFREPFFLWVHYKDPHAPYEVPAEYENLFPSRRGVENVAFDRVGQRYDARTVDRWISQYDAEIRFNDDSLDELFGALDRHDLWNSTLVVLTADHGESLGEHDYYSHGAYCYEPTAHVPLILVHPDLPAGVRVERPVSLVDLVPTVRQLLGLGPQPALEGQSFAPLLFGEPSSHYRDHHYVLSGGRAGYHTHAVSTDRYKLILEPDGRWIYFDVAIERTAAWWFGRVPHEYGFRVLLRELYDVEADRQETTNLAGKGLPIEAQLYDRLWSWIDVTYARMTVPPDQRRSEQVIELMRSLGYL